MMADFWAVIDAQLAELATARTAADVIRICPGSADDGNAGRGFFGGSGGDGSVFDALSDNGWRLVWYEADYYYTMQAPDGSLLTYCEGDMWEGPR